MADDNFEANPPHLDGVPDMSQLIYLEAPNILHNLEVRYGKSEIYTSISKVLIAVNPYQTLDCYTPKIIQEYREVAKDIKKRLKTDALPPHVFTVSQTAYYNLCKTQTNQSMIVCGESGSGKTESAKHLMRYLAAKTGLEEEEESKSNGASIEQQVLDANPIMESFGNAKTILNNNSSRFGKFTKIVFGQDLQRITGSFIETYLLEKSRVTRQDPGERNFHIFYMLCVSGSVLGDDFAALELTDPADFYYLNQTGDETPPNLGDEANMQQLFDSFETLNFSPVERMEIFRVVAGILHLGNVSFVENDKDGSQVDPECKEALRKAATMFGIEEAKLEERLISKTMKMVTQMIRKELRPEDALLNRDALSKALYNGLFNYIVKKINDGLYEEEARNPDLKWIGILDVFGFEKFEHNSFEQLCINFANERLQQYFNAYIIKSEQEEYIMEAIQWKPLKIPNNQDVIDLIQKRPQGILAVLDSACQTKVTPEAYIQNLMQQHSKHPRIKRVMRISKAGVKGFKPINGFQLIHYAAAVVYNVEDFLVKNADSTHPDNVTLFNTSQFAVTTQVLNITVATGKQGAKKPTGRRGKSGGFKSVGAFFSKQLEVLMKSLYETTPYFVRCIKPNPNKKPLQFDWNYVRPQLECGGIIEALRILKLGYPTRATYDDIFDRYGKILQPTPPDLNKRDFCEAVLRNCGETLSRSEFQLGLSKVFFRPGKQEFLEELLGGPDIDEETIFKIRRFLLNKRFYRVRGAIRVHLYFSKQLRLNRAKQRARLLLQMGKLMATTFVEQLNRSRSELAALSIQATSRACVAVDRARAMKRSAQAISLFCHRQRMRRGVSAELDKRVAKRRAMQSEAERQEKMRKEQERREARRAAAQEKEKARLEKIKAEKALKEKAREEAAQKQREREARVKELEQRERELREKEQAMQVAVTGEGKPLKEAIMELEIKEMSFKKQLEEFEAERRRFALTAESSTAATSGAVQGEDSMAKLLTNISSVMAGRDCVNAGNLTGNAAITMPAPVRVLVNDLGDLCWHAPPGAGAEKNKAEEDRGGVGEQEAKLGELLGSLPLVFISHVIDDKNRVLDEGGWGCHVVGKDKESGEQVVMHLEHESKESRNSFVTSLRYGIRNMKDFATISRPHADPARGNVLAAELTDRLSAVEGEVLRRGRILKEMGVEEFQSDAAGLVTGAGAGRKQSSSEHTGETSPFRWARRAESLQDIVQQSGGAPTDGGAEPLDKQMLRQEVGRLQSENQRLKERLTELDSELEFYSLKRKEEVGEEKQKQEAAVKQIVKKVNKAKVSVKKAEVSVKDAEKKVKARQDIIKQAMAVLSARENDLQSTEMTIKQLQAFSGEEGGDETTRKLKALRDEQKQARDQAKAQVVQNYEAMVSEAEVLNHMIEDLAAKNLLKENKEAEQMTLVKQVAGGKKGKGMKGEDGCVVS